MFSGVLVFSQPVCQCAVAQPWHQCANVQVTDVHRCPHIAKRFTKPFSPSSSSDSCLKLHVKCSYKEASFSHSTLKTESKQQWCLTSHSSCSRSRAACGWMRPPRSASI